MERVHLEGTIRGPFDVDLCRACRAFWFDAGEQFRLTPRSTLHLLRTLADGPEVGRSAAGTKRLCPVCASVLGRTYDIVAGQQLVFFRCPGRHGIFISVVDFLRSQGLMRGLSAHELDALRRKLTTISCSSCGAAISVETQTACEHCGASLAVLDREHLAAALRQLDAEARASAPVRAAPLSAPGEIVKEWRADRKAREADEEEDETLLFGRRRWRSRRRDVDLLDVGLTLIRELLGDR